MAQSGARAAIDDPVRMSPASNLTSASPNGRLASVDVYITSQCNRRCTYCFLPTEFFTSGVRMNMERLRQMKDGDNFDERWPLRLFGLAIALP